MGRTFWIGTALAIVSALVGCRSSSDCKADAECASSEFCHPVGWVCVPRVEVTDGGDSGSDGGVSDAGTDDAGVTDAGQVQQPPICNSADICWEHPLPQGNDLIGIWGSSNEQIFAVGSGGTILKWNGSIWNRMTTPSTAWFWRVQGAGESDAWAVGPTGVYRFDGVRWTSMPHPGVGFFTDISVRTPASVWLLSYDGSVHRWDGSDFHSTTSGATQFSRAVHASADDDVWIVGEKGEIHRFNGTQWIAVPSGSTADLQAVWGSGPSDVWIVGAGVVLRWNGLQLSQVPVPQGLVFTGIHGTGPNDVWLGGDELRHWDGKQWRVVPLPQGIPRTIGLHVQDGAVWVSSPPGIVAKYENGQWRTWGVSPRPNIWRIWARTQADVWAVGEEGTVLRKVGDSWEILPTGTTADLRDVHGHGPNDVWIVGSGGVILRWTGSEFANLTAQGGGREFSAVRVTAPGDVWLASRIDTLRFSGGAWTTHEKGGTSLWASAPSDVWLASGTTMHRWSGSSWNDYPVSSRVEAVHGASQNVVFAVGEGGAMFAFDGVSWKQKPTASDRNLRGVYVVNDKDVWMVGGVGTIAHFDGFNAVVLSSGTARELEAVTGAGPAPIWFAGEAGSILAFRP